ncbi:MerR family transcriptional regulator [Microbulbifer litoralis]|uniref:MerR family transcriptional regulator n=1 Tax=Microbulbifer litoralis TaxID=2933965 RepID=UPI002541AAC4|nr:MerR family transcriptional regulator [Microbulbifer sp. GX H0434]
MDSETPVIEVDVAAAKSGPEREPTLPIRTVAQRTGVNPVTLRAWERRYGLLKPARTGKGHRLYSEGDVARIEEILAWLARGVAIGKVRPLLDEGAEPERRDSWSQQVRETCVAVEKFAAGDLQRQLQQLLASYPLPMVLDRWLVPVHRQLNRRQRFGASVAQSFFWQLLIEQLSIGLRAGRQNLAQGGRGAHRTILLVGFAGGEQRVFAKLFAAALIAAGFDAVSLGPDLDLAELTLAVEKLGADGVICYSHNALPMAVFADRLARALRVLPVPLWFAGGIVGLQRRDLKKLVHDRNAGLLPADTAAALASLREQLP